MAPEAFPRITRSANSVVPQPLLLRVLRNNGDGTE